MSQDSQPQHVLHIRLLPGESIIVSGTIERHIHLRAGEMVIISQGIGSSLLPDNVADDHPMLSEEHGPHESEPERLESPFGVNEIAVAPSTLSQGLPPPYVPTERVLVFAAFNRVPTPEELRTYWPYQNTHVAYLIVAGARIAILPTWEMTKPLVHGISGPIYKKYPTFVAALESYTKCINRIGHFTYPVLRSLPADPSRLCRDPYDLLHPDMANDIEIAQDSQGHLYCYRMGGPESETLIRAQG
ncbi:hypothetical protein K435DRAFT_856344 [Dendrothele bispora CBS 962.96]|uniref:Uncharacterized protein n=1 Tax=Dendrothele bispora (strain CBS 962.96) TaxID=1314807 RepID=A0A4S8M9A2_DENBC|nr:hypothetical protein K435DRAFT_856344 [Dendrothele bispora CBS 962.96]